MTSAVTDVILSGSLGLQNGRQLAVLSQDFVLMSESEGSKLHCHTQVGDEQALCRLWI